MFAKTIELFAGTSGKKIRTDVDSNSRWLKWFTVIEMVYSNGRTVQIVVIAEGEKEGWYGWRFYSHE